ncbi:MAG: long-chain fatty acid--CoA ligase [bacterium]
MDRPWLRFYEKGIPRSLNIPDISMTDLFDQAVAENPSGVVISYFGKKMTFAELGRSVEQFAIALSRLGVREGDRVALIMPNIPQYPIAHFAVMKLGAVLVPTNPLYVERELEYQLNNSEAETAVVLDLVYPKVAKIKHKTALNNIIVTSVHEYFPWLLKWLYPIKAKTDGKWVKIDRGPGTHFFRDLMQEKFPVPLPKVDIKAKDTAMLLYTGGTTGVSKGAVLTHKNFVANVMQTRHWYSGLEEGKEVIVCALPFFHSYGLTTCLHFAIYLKSTMVLIPNPRDVKFVLKSIQKNHATLFSGVPTLYVAINNFANVGKYDLSSIKKCVSGGAPLPLTVAKEFESITGGKLVEGYGLSETSPVTHVNPINSKRKEGSIGLPVPNTDARVVDPETKKPLPVGEVGELAVKGPQVMKGYWKMEAATKEVLRNGWLYTGDMARMDEEGYFYIVDRKKDMIIAGGFNIFPREVEEVLFEHPKILEAAVIGVPDEYRGETVKAFIVCKRGETLTEEEVIEYCKEKMAPFKAPKLVEFRQGLPKSNIGKVLRRVLAEEEKAKARVPQNLQ